MNKEEYFSHARDLHFSLGGIIFMKKKILVIAVLIGIVCSLSASPSSNLYDLVVPEEYASLYLGSLGGVRSTNNLLQLDLNFSPTTTFNLALGLDGEYLWYRQTQDSDLTIPAEASFEITDTWLLFFLATTPAYRTYTLDLEGLLGFWGVGTEITSFSSRIPFTGTPTIDAKFYPYGEFGIGRTYSLTNLKKIETIMERWGITPTEEMILQVAQIWYNKQQITTKFSDDYSKVHLEYYEAVAQALGAPDRVADLILLDKSQVYNFNIARYAKLRKGWYAALRLVPGLVNSTWAGTSTTNFDGALKILGEYSDFLVEDSIHLVTSGEITVGFDTGKAKKFYSQIEVVGTVTYLPENYRWWADGTLSFTFDTRTTPKVSLDMNAQLNYLINPNFTVYGGTSLHLGAGSTEKLSVFAGGRIRLW